VESIFKGYTVDPYLFSMTGTVFVLFTQHINSQDNISNTFCHTCTGIPFLNDIQH